MSRLFRIAFWAALLLSFTMAVLPEPPEPPGSPPDKMLHVLAFLTLTALAVAAYPRLSLVRIGLSLCAFGLLIELIQLIPALNRDGEFLDWVADALAVGFVLVTVSVLRRARLRRAESPRAAEHRDEQG